MPGFTTSEQKNEWKISKQYSNQFGQSNHKVVCCAVHLTERKAILIQSIAAH
jgi:hypothetical protein